jgi:hypothetical protein
MGAKIARISCGDFQEMLSFRLNLQWCINGALMVEIESLKNEYH